MLPYAETLMPRWKKLTGGSKPPLFHFSTLEPHKPLTSYFIQLMIDVFYRLGSSFLFFILTLTPKNPR
jgi:hypothetical protein